MAETGNGVPYLELADPPNIASGTQGIADWLDDALGGGATQQIPTADQTQDNKLAWRYPRARVSGTKASPPSGSLGDLWTPASGEDSGALFVHNGTSFSRIRPDLTPYPLGLLSSSTRSNLLTISSLDTWTDISDLSVSVTLSSTRRYVVRVQAGCQILPNPDATDDYQSAYGRILVGATDAGRFLAWRTPKPPTGDSAACIASAETPPFTGPGGGAVTVKAQGYRLGLAGEAHAVLIGGGGDFGLAHLSVYDVGPAPA